MPRLPRLAALALVLALPGVGGPGLVLTGCDSGPATCPGGQIQTVNLAAGTGAAATDSSVVRLTYTGELDDGREVFSGTNETVDLAESAPPGFRQGVAGMRVNGRRRFTLPPNLGFGPDGVGTAIPPCARLTFTVELHEILPTTCGNNGELVTEDQVVGTGEAATATSRVTVNYTLTLSGQTTPIQTASAVQFLLSDSSLILGFRQGIVGMREGGTRRLRIPPNLAYGLEGSPPQIPSCATLVFDVELLEVN